MLGKRIIKFEGSKLGLIIHADKTGFRRLNHIMLLKTYPLKLQGEAQVTVCYKDHQVMIPLVVVKGI